MQYLPTEDFSQNQKQIIQFRSQQVVLATKFPHLCDIARFTASTYCEIISDFKRKASQSSVLLTKIPPFFNRKASQSFDALEALS